MKRAMGDRLTTQSTGSAIVPPRDHRVEQIGDLLGWQAAPSGVTTLGRYIDELSVTGLTSNVSNPDLVQVHARQLARSRSRRSRWFLLALVTAVVIVIVAVIGGVRY